MDKYTFFNYTFEELGNITKYSVDNIKLLNSFLHLHDFKDRKLSEIHCIDSYFINNLSANGIKKSKEYIIMYENSKYNDMANKYGIDNAEIDKLFSLCDLMRLPGVKSIRSKLYFKCGYKSIKDFVDKDAKDIQKQIEKQIIENGWEEEVPLLKELKTQIAVSKILPYLGKQ